MFLQLLIRQPVFSDTMKVGAYDTKFAGTANSKHFTIECLCKPQVHDEVQ